MFISYPPPAGEAADHWEICTVDSSRNNEIKWSGGESASVQGGRDVWPEWCPEKHGRGWCFWKINEWLFWWVGWDTAHIDYKTAKYVIKKSVDALFDCLEGKIVTWQWMTSPKEHVVRSLWTHIYTHS